MSKCLYCNKILKRKRINSSRDKRGWQWESPATFRGRKFCNVQCSFKGRPVDSLDHLSILSLYTGGLSTYKIAEKLKLKPNSVRSFLNKMGAIRTPMGILVEKAVAKLLKKQGKKVERQRGDAPFDLLVDGKRIDVKSAHLSGARKNHYHFSLQCPHKKNNTWKNLQEAIDEFFLVLLDEPKMPIYSLPSLELRPYQRGLNVPKSLDTKYNLRLINYLI